MYNDIPQGVLVRQTEIGEYVNRIKTLDGRYGNVVYEKSIQNIIGKTVISNHLFKIFEPLSVNTATLYSVVSDILDNVYSPQIVLNDDNIDLIGIMIDNEIRKVVKYAFGINEQQLNNINLNASINSLKSDLKYITE